MSKYVIDGALLRSMECVSTNDKRTNDAETICKNKMWRQNPSVLVLIIFSNSRLLRNEKNIKQFYDVDRHFVEDCNKVIEDQRFPN